MTSTQSRSVPDVTCEQPPAEELPGEQPADTLLSGRPPGLVARGLTRVIGWYQLGHQDRPSPCRFVPSCSTYALEAVEAHGAVAGSWLAARRLLRCHPWGRHGFDPVPPPSARLKRADRRV